MHAWRLLDDTFPTWPSTGTSRKGRVELVLNLSKLNVKAPRVHHLFLLKILEVSWKHTAMMSQKGLHLVRLHCRDQRLKGFPNLMLVVGIQIRLNLWEDLLNRGITHHCFRCRKAMLHECPLNHHIVSE